MINNRPVGLWMLPAHIGTSRGALAALQRDFAQLRTLDHPHIARLLELGCNGQQYYVTGERLDGEPLRDVLTHLLPERLEVGEADDVVRAIGSALVYAHEHDVVHGDVRAENVLVTMDRRFVLTNFLARRVAKVSGRPPRTSDDLTGLARLAAELYTGSSSPHALRAAAHSGVPAARLQAIRAVLETPSGRRSGSVAEFLAAAGLAFAGAGATARTYSSTQPRNWSLWRLVLPAAAVVAIGTLVAAYTAGDEWRESAVDLQRRGLDALRTVATRPTPATEAEPTPPAAAGPPRGDATPMARDRAANTPQNGSLSNAADRSPTPLPPNGAASTAANSSPTPSSAAVVAPQPIPPETDVEAPVVPAPEPRPTTAPATPPAPSAPAATTAAARDDRPARRGDPAVLSLGVPRIAAREDHSVVAIDVFRSGDTAREIAVGWWTTPDTAHEDEDYAPGSRKTLTFPAGATVERLLIPIVNDGVRESDEVFTVHLSRPRTGGVTGGVTATRVTLHDDD